mgnify:CR=1 FL=1
MFLFFAVAVAVAVAAVASEWYVNHCILCLVCVHRTGATHFIIEEVYNQDSDRTSASHIITVNGLVYDFWTAKMLIKLVRLEIVSAVAILYC